MGQTEEDDHEYDGQMMWKNNVTMIYTLSMKAADRTEWRQMVKHVLDTNGH